MKSEDLAPYEGKAVYFFHREGKQFPQPSRGTRGIVYKGVCYDISVQHSKHSLLPTIHLEAMRTEYIAQIVPLKKKQQSDLERKICTSLKRDQTEFVSLKVPLVFDLWREDREKKKDKKEEEKARATPSFYQQHFQLTQEQTAESLQRLLLNSKIVLLPDSHY